MTEALPTDLIVQKCHDRKWQYPEPIEDLDAWISTNLDAFDPQVAHRLYWPDRPYEPGMDILVVDGATTQGPVIARTNPDARVVATALDEASLAHGIYLRHKYRLLNLEVRLLATDKVAELDRSFDLVIASGVLQKAGYAEAQLGMKSLAQLLRPEGVAAFLLYSRYVPGEPEAGYRTGQTPLHTGVFNVSAQDCLALVEGAGLVFQDWLFKSPYYLPADDARDDGIFDAIKALPEPQRWSVLEALRNPTGCHLFTACRPERPAKTYRIDFDIPEALDYVPAWRLRAGLEGRHSVRPGWSMPLEPVWREMADKINGENTIRQIAGVRDLNPVAAELIKELWRMDFVSVGI